MSVLIKCMEMPTNCMLCPLCVEEADPANGEMYMVTGTLMPPCTRERLDNCPLVPVPPHGDLIERDKLLNGDGVYLVSFQKSAIDTMKIIKAPTIIPAEEGEK